jgi:predicted nucleic acid-binding protein
VIYLVDTSVAIKWVHTEGESDVEPARLLLSAHRDGAARAFILDLGVYEFGNVLTRALRQPAAVVSQLLDLLHRLCGPFVHPAPSWHAEAARLAERHGLTFYDASWAAAALALGCPLVSSDLRLREAGAIGPAEAAALL